MVALIAHLAILDERRLHLDEGFPSLFAYCTGALHLSEHAAYGRIEAARAARRFPVLLGMIADGSLTLTTVGLLSPHLKETNCTELLAAATHKSRRHVEELLARLYPQDAVPSTIRRLPQPQPWPRATEQTYPRPLHPGTELSTTEATVLPDGVEGPTASPIVVGPVPRPTPQPAVVAPLGLERYRVQFTMSAETHDKLRLARDLLSHQIPDGDLAAVFDRALTLLVETLAREKFAAADRPRTRPSAPGREGALPSRHIPADVRRAVWVRDGGRCAFVARNGRRCEARRFLEFHHVEPFGTGGGASVDNIELRCRAHNLHEATLFFGEAQLESLTRQRASQPALANGAGASVASAPDPQAIPPASRAGPR
jgi:hypothetical protein